LIVGAGALILNCDDFSLLKQCQKNINVFVVVSQVADIDAGGTDLGDVIP
jgi:hypothetical protein